MRQVLLLAAPVLGTLFRMGYNARHGHGLVLSPSSSLSLAGKLVEAGVLSHTLGAHLPGKPSTPL
jgi:hypothetical protein